MSNKPLKKTDANKEWISKRKNRNIKSKLEYHLIICEGTKTEPNYFNGLKSLIKEKNKDKIIIEVKGKGRGTTTLLNEAIKEVQKSTNYISNVWLVYDKDDFSDENFNEVVQKCNELNEQDNTVFHAMWSNESIETWILLHFIKFDTPMNRKDCIKKINENYKQEKLGKYEKNDVEVFNKLRYHLNDAIKNAKWLDEKYENLLPSEMNPCTKVYELVELLSKYI